jgi:short-subunit dehydrogenase
MKYIITGTSSGLGYCLAEKLILQGSVAGISRTIGKSCKFSTSAFTHVSFDLAQLADSEKFEYLINNLITFINNEPFTIILNAANFYSGENRFNDDQLKRIFQINVFSLINLTNSITNPLLRRVFIVNSISGLIGQSKQHEYSASKHAVMGFSRSLIKSAKESDYDVMVINPGGMKTELWNDYKSIDTSCFLLPETVADICIALLSIKERTFIENMVILPPSDV